MSAELIAAVRSLLLPISAQRETAHIEFVTARLTELGVSSEGHASWVGLALAQWRSSGQPPPALARLVRDTLSPDGQGSFMVEEALAGDPAWAQIATRASEQYFALHKAMVESDLLNHDFARQLLGQLGWVARLAVSERMSASEISRLIAARDPRLAQRWSVVRRMLGKLGLAPEITVPDVQAIYAEDGENDAALFSDLNVPGSISLAATVARTLGYEGDLEGWLTDLFIRDCHEPYLLILHYQMMIQARFDHPPSYAYEFTPRGQAVAWLNQQYIDAGIPVAQNAFLNNAKATPRFDAGWVAGRADHPRAARAMAGVFGGMETLGALAKVEIASRLRALLRRFVRLREQGQGALPHALPDLTTEQLKRLLDAVAQGNSATTGILEQRIVDALGSLRHPRAEGWAPRGLGDSVFAPNLPRRKCGDCEFERATQAAPMIRAYEAHGGQLSRPYVEDHLSTLAEILRQRSDDLVAVAPLEQWSVRVTFISHSTLGALPADRHVATANGLISVTLDYMTFGGARDELLAAPELVALGNQHIKAGLNSPYVHPRVRERALALLAP